MIAIHDEGVAYLEKRSGTLIHSQRFTSEAVVNLLNVTYETLRATYRQIHLPIVDWDGSFKSMELFDHLARNNVAINNSLVLPDVFALIGNEVFTLKPKILGIRSGKSRYINYIHDVYEVRGVKEGVHPSQPILEEEATDILLTNREGHENPNLIFALGGYFHYGYKLGANYYLPYAAVYNGGVKDGVQLSALDLSELDCGVPVNMGNLTSIIDGVVSINYPADGYSGMLLFVGGKPILNITNDHDIIYTNKVFKLPADKLNITTGHLSQFCKDYGYSEITLAELINHDTSFVVPYRGDLAVEFTTTKNEVNSDGFILTPFEEYHGEMLIDSEGQMIPFILMGTDNQGNSKEATMTHLGHRYSNDLTTTNFQRVEGLWDTSFKPFTDKHMGLRHKKRKPHLSLVQFSGFRNFVYEGM